MDSLPSTLDEWREYLAEAFAKVTGCTSKEQFWFGQYETGMRLLEMQEHLESQDWKRLVQEQGITTTMQREWIHIFLGEARDYVKQQEKHNHE